MNSISKKCKKCMKDFKIVYFSALVTDFGSSLFPNMVLRLVSHIASVAQHCQARAQKARLAL